MLTFEQIKELVELVAQRQLQGMELERSGFRLKIDGRPSAPVAAAPAPADYAAASAAPAPAPAPALSQAAAPASAKAAPEPAGGGAPAGSHTLNSPIVGTFYRSPSPDAPSFVEVGSRVKKGQVLCIIEAMKLMNEIESDVDGEVAQIFPQNAQAVEFGEPLFAIRPA
ncbi:MAG TPA: acetyl-CoA carboxylase biotin carboxyl carrier protein [Thermoanaerobaculia bacterium]|nr:acetyl-CoA carboxylase biotin carboxyl carrier protein [Thermoanaerobaculia bacterium]